MNGHNWAICYKNTPNTHLANFHGGGGDFQFPRRKSLNKHGSIRSKWSDLLTNLYGFSVRPSLNNHKLGLHSLSQVGVACERTCRCYSSCLGRRTDDWQLLLTGWQRCSVDNWPAAGALLTAIHKQNTPVTWPSVAATDLFTGHRGNSTLDNNIAFLWLFF